MTQALGALTAEISATRYHDFSYGHVVLGHESKCANLHGHNGRVTFTVVGPQLDSVGRVVDFSVIKTLLCYWVEEHWDHRFLISHEHPLATLLSQNDPTVVVVPFNPTAENLAMYLLKVIAPMQLAGTELVCHSVDFEETRKCSAKVSIPWSPMQIGEQSYFGNLVRKQAQDETGIFPQGVQNVWPE